MGVVKFDIESKELPFKNINFTSHEDIYDFLWILDAVIDAANKMNNEALITKVDFFELVDEVNNNALNEYILIQTGTKPLKREDYGLEILEVVAKRLNQNLVDCESELSEAFDLIMSSKHRKWYREYLHNFKGKRISEKPKSSELTSGDVENLKNLDYTKKYLFKKKVSVNETYPNELNELLQLRKKTINRIKTLEKKKTLTPKQEKELKFKYQDIVRINLDISEMKRSFDFEIAKTNRKGRSDNRSSFNEDYHEKIDDNEYANKVIDEFNYNKIIKTAESCLTDKQLLIFYLFYINNLSQNEIAEIVDDSQGNVSRDLNNIIKKVKQNM